MIALLMALILPGAALDPVVSPFHLSAFVGLESDVKQSDNPWIELDAQAEFGTVAFLRGAYAQPTGIGQIGEAAGLIRESHALCLGTEWRREWWWFAAGAGWTWRRLDTTVTYLDPREIFIEDQNGLHTTKSYSTFFSSYKQIGWRWPQRIEDNGPYVMGEIGLGWQNVSMCIRSEYRFCPAMGIFCRFRIP